MSLGTFELTTEIGMPENFQGKRATGEDINWDLDGPTKAKSKADGL